MEEEFNYNFSKFKSANYELDEALLNKFQPIAKKLNLSQESVESLMEIALEMSEKQRAMYEKDEKEKRDNDIKKYDKMFRDDKELPDLNSNDAKEYMHCANSAYSEFCSTKLKEFFELTGLNYHPEIIKLFHKIGELSAADGVNYSGRPSLEDLSPAEILYGKNE